MLVIVAHHVTRAGWKHLAQSCWDLLGLVGTCWGLSGLVGACQDLSGVCWDLLGLVGKL